MMCEMIPMKYFLQEAMQIWIAVLLPLDYLYYEILLIMVHLRFLQTIRKTTVVRYGDSGF